MIIVDIDGTLSIVGDRLKYLKNPKDWDSFYAHCGEDKPHKDIIKLVNKLSKTYSIVLCTGRRESCRKDTEDWLKFYGVKYDRILMRKNGDFRDDVEVKPELLSNVGYTPDYVFLILEDRSSVVKRWRELGYRCLQVANGDF